MGMPILKNEKPKYLLSAVVDGKYFFKFIEKNIGIRLIGSDCFRNSSSNPIRIPPPRKIKIVTNMRFDSFRRSWCRSRSERLGVYLSWRKPNRRSWNLKLRWQFTCCFKFGLFLTDLFFNLRVANVSYIQWGKKCGEDLQNQCTKKKNRYKKLRTQV